VIDGVIDDATDCNAAGGTVLLGDGGGYGENYPDSMRCVTVSNIVCNSRSAIAMQGFLTDSTICNVINRNPDCPVLDVSRENGLKNVVTSNLVTVGDKKE
jgi:hypothetical protein